MGSKAAEYVSRTSIGAYFHSARESRKLVLVIVAIALLLDNMLLTTVVPIIPEFLYHVRHRYDHLTTTQRPKVYRYRTTPTTTEMVEVVIHANVSIGQNSEMENITMDLEELELTTLRSTTLSELDKKHKELVEENLEVGVMFASKAFVQLIANPFVGRLTNSIGYSIPMFAGFIIMFLSTVIFAFGRSYAVLFFCSSASRHRIFLLKRLRHGNVSRQIHR